MLQKRDIEKRASEENEKALEKSHFTKRSKSKIQAFRKQKGEKHTQ